MGGAGRDAAIGVVGASQAAVEFADRLRRGGHAGPITLLGREPHAPYHRPPLSKAWLAGAVTPDALALRGPEHYARHGIELVTGAEVTALERDGHGMIVHWSGGSRHVDRVVLATGARPVRPRLPGGDHPDVLTLRDLDDARRLAGRVDAGPVVVLGGGFIGLEVAATLRALDAQVTVVEAGPRLLGRSVDAGTADVLLRAHREEGIGVELGVTADRIGAGRDGSLRAVVLSDGRRLPAATVVVGVGVRPRTDLAEARGLDCDGGVVVDEGCRTSDGTTLAIGDCTVQVTGDGRRQRFESVDNAVEQAARAADTVLGVASPPRPAPWFWSDQGARKLQIVGDSAGHREVVVRTDPARPRRRVALYFGEGGFLGAECLDAPADFVALRTALARGVRPTPESVADASVPLKTLLAAAAGAATTEGAAR